jgi:hypothetical protein
VIATVMVLQALEGHSDREACRALRPPCDWDDPADVDRLVSELVDDANELV